MLLLPHFAYVAVISLVLVLQTTAQTSPVTVSLKTGTFQGVRSLNNGTEHWLGVPFAQPPVGSLRFKAPVAITTPAKGVQDASRFGNACPQPASGSLGAPVGEDCLKLNVWRPLNTTAASNLPVLVWFYGGAWNIGASSDAQTDPTVLLQRSVTIGKPFIFVSVNYRINTFGFLSSSFQAPQDLNAGLHDQRLALQFIQQNIASFGGDPTKVTIWGQSAGAGSVEAHILFPAAETLFRAGISDSPTGPFKNSPFSFQYDEAGKPFARLVEGTGCPLSSASIACLQKVPFETLLNISNTMITGTLNHQLWEPTVGPAGSFVPERASARIESGNLLRVPYLAGTNLNEGTTFAQAVRNLSHPGMTEDEAFDNYIGNLVLDNRTFTADVLNEIHTLYPANDPTAGGAFNTGDSLFDRAESWYTDIMFLAPRRFFFNKAASISSQPLFGYFFDEFIPGNDPSLGVFHASELGLLYGSGPPVEHDFSNTMKDFWISFVSDLNPGGNWTQFTSAKRQVLQLKRNNITIIPDDFNEVKTNFLTSAEVLDEMEK